MIVAKVLIVALSNNLIKRDSIIVIRNQRFDVLAQGHADDNKLLTYFHFNVQDFTWQDDDSFYIDVY